MSNIEQTVFCSGCGVEITWAPVVKGDRHYCCEDCMHGRGCTCATRQEFDDDRRATPASPNTPLTGYL